MKIRIARMMIINSCAPMIKLFSETFTNIVFISLINNEAFLEAVTEFKNLAAVLLVRVVWYAAEQLFKNYKKRRNVK